MSVIKTAQPVFGLMHLQNRMPTTPLKPDKVIKNGWTKHILREAMRNTVPEKIRKRKDKVGFMTPEDEWFRSEHFKSFILEMLNSKAFHSRGIINYNQAINLYQQHLAGKINISKEIWKWINLEMWFRKFID